MWNVSPPPKEQDVWIFSFDDFENNLKFCVTSRIFSVSFLIVITKSQVRFQITLNTVDQSY